MNEEYLCSRVSEQEAASPVTERKERDMSQGWRINMIKQNVTVGLRLTIMLLYPSRVWEKYTFMTGS